MVGGGNTAVEEALYLSNIASTVDVVHRRDRFRAEKILADRLTAKAREANVAIRWNHVVDEVLGDDSGVTGLRIRSTGSGAFRELGVEGVFIAIGHTPNTALFEGQLDMPEAISGSEAGSTATPPRPAYRGCSRPATWPTRSTARPSPRPGAGAWPPWTRRSTSNPSGDAGRPAREDGSPRRPRPAAPGGAAWFIDPGSPPTPFRIR